MERSRNHLKTTSIIVLIFAALSLISIILALTIGDLNNVSIPEGAPANTLLITKIILAAFSGILLAPQIYIGFKGIKVAKHPDSSRAHIVWALILLVFSVIALISPIVAIVNKESVFDNVGTLITTLLEVLIFFDYVRYARAVAEAR